MVTITLISELTNSSIDPVTSDIIQNSLVTISEEMFVAMARSAMSSVIYEVLDFGAAITDAEGNLTSVGAGIPGFVGMLAPAVQSIIEKYRNKEINPEDIFISNDPFTGGVSHINDVVLAKPVFFSGQLVAWTANKGHWVDIGGMVPGSMSPDATELFQEGLILPSLKLSEKGQWVESIFEIIRANSRLPEQVMGDLWAGIAALRVGEQRLLTLCRKYAPETLLESIRLYFDYGEIMARYGLAQLPQGVFEGVDTLDDGRRIKALITITDEQMVIDLRDNPKQDRGPINGTREATLVSAQAVFKAITAPDFQVNAGSFRPLKLLTRPGTIFDAERPAAVGLYYENKIRSTDLICKTLAPYMPDRIPAGHFSSICATVIRSLSRGQGEKTFVEPETGGWGADLNRDGDNAQFSISHGDTFNCPIEVNEARNGIQVDRYVLNPEASGAGRFRGGKGIELHYRIIEEQGWVTAGYTRSVIPPWGIAGGGEGTVNRLEIERVGGKLELHNNASNLELTKGDVVCITTGNGGGYGDPVERDGRALQNDIRNGYVTVEEAVNVYKIDPAVAVEKAGSIPVCRNIREQLTNSNGEHKRNRRGVIDG